METKQAILQRKSTRSYHPDQLPEEVLNHILVAGSAAPIAMKKYETMHITVIQDQGLLSDINDQLKQNASRPGEPLYGAPTLIVVSSKDNPDTMAYANASCMLENMFLTATDQGIGSVYIWSASLVLKANPELCQKLHLPDGFSPIASGVFGYPAQPDDSPKLEQVQIETNRI